MNLISSRAGKCKNKSGANKGEGRTPCIAINESLSRSVQSNQSQPPAFVSLMMFSYKVIIDIQSLIYIYLNQHNINIHCEFWRFSTLKFPLGRKSTNGFWRLSDSFWNVCFLWKHQSWKLFYTCCVFLCFVSNGFYEIRALSGPWTLKTLEARCYCCCCTSHGRHEKTWLHRNVGLEGSLTTDVINIAPAYIK